MKLKRITAVLLSVLMLLAVSLSAADAITVKIDGNEYTFASPSPTTGDCRVLIIRVGFADYPADGDEYPATSEEELLSYFDDSEDSVRTFYRNSSYGQLSLSCDRVYTYNSENERSSYEDGHSVSLTLLQEALDALKDEIDYTRYDSNGDNAVDFVCLQYSGPGGEFGSAWWSYVTNSQGVTAGDMQVPIYAFIHGDSVVYCHEFGHLLGATDYYNTRDGDGQILGSFDIMCNNEGDHNGFTKWTYGWFSDDDIELIDRERGDTYVELAPFETDLGDGKKIAVVAPSFNQETPFLSEFFLVEYDTGQRNNAQVFSEYSGTPGLRIFHVNAEDPVISQGGILADFSRSNTRIGMNLIHNMKNERSDPHFWRFTELFFTDGDSLTTEGFPNTGFNTETMFNGKYTGISFTDFKTGDRASFKVSFSDEMPKPVEYKLNISPVKLDQDITLSLESDVPLFRKKSTDEGYEAPYMINEKGDKLTVDIQSSNESYFNFNITYTNTYPELLPDTKYTLVIPKGYFMTGYEQELDEYRYDLTTDTFLSLTAIEKYREETGKRTSNVFAVTDNTYGRIVLDPSAKKCTFSEYNLIGELLDTVEFDAPKYEGEGQRLFGCRAYRLADDNFAFCVNTFEKSYFTKIDRKGNLLSETFSIDDDLPNEYPGGLSSVDFDVFGNGLFKYLDITDGTYENMVITVDFEKGISVTYPLITGLHYILSDDLLAIQQYTSEGIILHFYDSSGKALFNVPVSGRLIGVYENRGNITAISSDIITKEDGKRAAVTIDETYDSKGKLISKTDITDKGKIFNQLDSFDRIIVTDEGYLYMQRTDPYSGEKSVLTCDGEYNSFGVLKFDKNTRLEFLGECGLCNRAQYLSDIDDYMNILSRFNAGDFEIVKKEEPEEDTTESAAEESTSSASHETYDSTDSTSAKSTANSSTPSRVSGSGVVKTGDSLFASVMLAAVLLLLGILAAFRKRIYR